MRSRHLESHRTGRIGWLRAAVLGANDGIVSTASLVLGVAAAHGSREAILVAGVAGLVAGAMSMAAGEYVSVYSQADTEKAELDRERAELAADSAGRNFQLAEIQHLADFDFARIGNERFVRSAELRGQHFVEILLLLIRELKVATRLFFDQANVSDIPPELGRRRAAASSEHATAEDQQHHYPTQVHKSHPGRERFVAGRQIQYG